MSRILIVDDDPQIGETLATLVVRHWAPVSDGFKLARRPAPLRQTEIDLVFLMRLPDGNGLDALGEISALDNPPHVIVLTGQGDPEGAELAIQSGWTIWSSPLPSVRSAIL